MMYMMFPWDTTFYIYETSLTKTIISSLFSARPRL